MIVRLLYALTFVWSSAETEEYINLALSLRVGTFALNGAPTTVSPVLLPLLASPFPTVEAFLLAQAFLGTLTCWLLYLTARKSRISSWGTWLFVFAPLPIHYTAAVLPETLLIFLVVAAVYFWTAGNWYVAGFAFGLAALTGPVVLPLLAFAVLVTAVRKQSLKPVLLIAGTALLVALPWMIRNSIVEGGPMTTQQISIGRDLLYGTFRKDEIVEGSLTATVAKFPKETYLRAAVERIGVDPVSWVMARIEQYPRLFIDTGGNLTSNFEFRLFLVLVQLAIGVFAFIGVRDLSFPLWIVPLFVAGYYLPFWAESRFFLPAVPFVCLSAGVGFKKLRLSSRGARSKGGDEAAPSGIPRRT